MYTQRTPQRRFETSEPERGPHSWSGAVPGCPAYWSGASAVSGSLMEEGEQTKGTENRSLAVGLATPAAWMEELE